jgi:hypothetical protein
MQTLGDLLVPRPHRVASLDDSFVLPDRPAIRGTRSPAEARLYSELGRLGLEPRTAGEGDPPDVRLSIEEAPELGDEGYRLDVTSGGIELVAASRKGLFYAAATLAQWIELHRTEDGRPPSRLGCLSIRDRPDFAVRGVMLDVSRDKVPRMETLFDLVDLLAGLKYNQLQLYMEHTFAYSGHETVWQDASPFTADELSRLDDYSADRYVELVPNQQSFGHFHRWLIHEPYRELAECPAGVKHAFSLEPEPFSLCPLDPRVPELLAGLYDELLPSFRSRLFNVGCDETFDLGLGRSRAACEEQGREQVYVDFLNRVNSLVSERGRRMQFWGDVILKRPELLVELPEDAIALEWGYEADHPFAEDCRRFAESGREFYVCPGTSSWLSFAGRTRNAVLNLASAAVHGKAHGAAGYLVTDWGDCGHLQPLTASYPGLVAGAAFAWNEETARAPLELPLADLLDRHVFRDRAELAGRVTCGLGDAYHEARTTRRNGSDLFYLVVFALLDREGGRIRAATVENLDRALEYVESTTSPHSGMRLDRGDAEIVERELRWTADVLAFACRFGSARVESGDLTSFSAMSGNQRRELRGELQELIERHRDVFLSRNRPGGVGKSTGWLSRLAKLL